MLHLLSYTVYQDTACFGDDVGSTLRSIDCDGLELLTSYDPPPIELVENTVTVHLPYAIDWLSGWEGRVYDVDEESIPYMFYGRDRDEVSSALATSIMCAAPMDPLHGVLHACNADIPELHSRRYSRPDAYVVEAFCEMVNSAVSLLPHGRLPFTLAFENLWWPGLRLLDGTGYRMLEERLEFDDWCLCIDTGHMMNCLPGIHTEEDGIDALLDVFHGYDRDIVDRVHALHFHYSASSGYRDTFPERGLDDGSDVMAFINDAYSHVARIDRHMPFSSPRCNEILDVLEPDVVVHELPGSKTDMLSDYRQQRSLIR